MTHEDLNKRLKKIDSRFDMIIYNRPEQIKTHYGMCSVRFNKQHVHSMKQGEIPRYPNKNYRDIETKDGKDFVVRHKSMWELGYKLMRKGMLSSSQRRQLVQ